MVIVVLALFSGMVQPCLLKDSTTKPSIQEWLHQCRLYRLTLTFIKVDAVEPNIDANVNVIANVYATVTTHDDVKHAEHAKHEQNCFVAVVNVFVTGSGKS